MPETLHIDYTTLDTSTTASEEVALERGPLTGRLILSLRRNGQTQGFAMLTDEDARRLIGALEDATGTGTCSVLGCGEGQDYWAHRPSSQCTPCHAPNDHHAYRGRR